MKMRLFDVFVYVFGLWDAGKTSAFDVIYWKSFALFLGDENFPFSVCWHHDPALQFVR